VPRIRYRGPPARADTCAISILPLAVDEAFIEKHKIDFIAHDDLPCVPLRCVHGCRSA
jgi:hypothetical protein